MYTRHKFPLTSAFVLQTKELKMAHYVDGFVAPVAKKISRQIKRWPETATKSGWNTPRYSTQSAELIT